MLLNLHELFCFLKGFLIGNVASLLASEWLGVPSKFHVHGATVYTGHDVPKHMLHQNALNSKLLHNA